MRTGLYFFIYRGREVGGYRSRTEAIRSIKEYYKRGKLRHTELFYQETAHSKVFIGRFGKP